LTPLLTDAPIDLSDLLAAVSEPHCGAVTLFVGTVRSDNGGRAVTGIDYSAYQDMAIRELGRIADEATERFGAVRVRVVHRLGYLSVGEASVAIATAHPHRAEALDASRYVIEALKTRVPIWKREHYVDGAREWVDPTGGRAEAAP
jgi:molybdopterin synthase catalytic subunit